MKISIIAGSHRLESESTRVAHYLECNLHNFKVDSTYLLDLAGNPLPLWDEGAWSDDEKWSQAWAPVASELQDSDGFVVVSPEWSGMVPAGLKNLFLLCGNRVLAHKPALIVAVSAGPGGSYPVAELRMSSYKNTHICYLPEHIIVRNVGEVLKEAEPVNRKDERLRKRLDFNCRLLIEYARALRAVRECTAIDLSEYPHGM